MRVFRGGKGEGGAFLLQAMALVLLLALMVAMGARLLLGRAMIVERTIQAEAERNIAMAVESIVNNCLFGADDCSLAACLLPGSLGGRRIEVSATGAMPRCTIRITVRS